MILMSENCLHIFYVGLFTVAVSKIVPSKLKCAELPRQQF